MSSMTLASVFTSCSLSSAWSTAFLASGSLAEFLLALCWQRTCSQDELLRWCSDCPARDSTPIWTAVFLLLFAFWTAIFSCCWGVSDELRSSYFFLFVFGCKFGNHIFRSPKIDRHSVILSGLIAGCWGALETIGISSSFASLFFGSSASSARERPAFTPAAPPAAPVWQTQPQRLDGLGMLGCY